MHASGGAASACMKCRTGLKGRVSVKGQNYLRTGKEEEEARVLLVVVIIFRV
jgi:RNase P/RNase MRP subunit p29